ncbi:MAG TPA: lysylphosphatidylglycerol synthase domain-containing protein [Polyangiaceae bacterium]
MKPAADIAAPEVKGVKRRVVARVVAALVGLALVAYLVRGAGPERVAAVLWQAGRWLPLIFALEVFQVGTDFFALRSILGGFWRKIPAATWVRSSAIAYAMMTLVPAGRAAGEVTRATLFSRFVGTPRAATTSTCLQAAYLSANGVLSLVAGVAVASRFGFQSPLAMLLGGNVLFQALIAGSLLAILRAARFGRWLERMRRRFVPGAKESPPLDPEERRRIPWRAALVCSMGRAAQTVQYGIILHAVGGVLTVHNAFITHGIHLVGATLGDMLPNQLGVTDGFFRAFAGDLGFADEPARALSIAFVIRIAQLSLAATCVVVASVMKPAASRDGAEPAPMRADARS